jgi:hypothetical protein
MSSDFAPRDDLDLRECYIRNLRPPLPEDAPAYALVDQASGVISQLEADLRAARRALRDARQDRVLGAPLSADTRAALHHACSLGPWTPTRAFRPQAKLQRTENLTAALETAGIKENT